MYQFFTQTNWLRDSVTIAAIVISYLAYKFCWHLREKITTERKVIEHFESVYPQHTAPIRAIRTDVIKNDFGDRLVYGVILGLIVVLTTLVVLLSSGNLHIGKTHAGF